MGMPAGNQRQVNRGYINEQGHGDTEDANPKPPIAVRTSPVGTMNMRFMMMIVLDLIHFILLLSRIVPIQVCHCAGYHYCSSLLMERSSGAKPS